MKRKLLFALALAMALTAGAKGGKSLSRSKLCGMWQNCYVSIEQGQPRVHFLPVLKMLNPDGSFVNLFNQDKRHCSFISTMGKWSLTSDSSYVESVTRSITAPGLTGRENKIVYRLQGDNFVVLRFQTGTDGKWATEYWVRVIQPERIEQQGSGVATPDGGTLMNNFRQEYESQMTDDD